MLFPDGRVVRARGLRAGRPEGPTPDFGIYLGSVDTGAFDWPSRVVRWPDFRTPSNPSDAVAALRDAFQRSASERVEVACGGGVGRTGTALAIMAVFAGVPRDHAVAWVRGAYCPKAVETRWQRRWVEHGASIDG